MKVKELIERLEKINPDFDVILSEDSEGNGFNNCVDVELHKYDNEDGHEVFPPIFDDAFADGWFGLEDGEYFESLKFCVVLYPL